MLMGGVMMVLAIPVLFLISQETRQSPGLGEWVLVTISAIANIGIMFYHYVVPAHPKFLMIPWRRRVLRTHIASGTVELCAGLFVCFGSGPLIPSIAVVMGLASLVHASSAFAQTPIVFGSKAVMVPSYLLCIVTHAFCGSMLISHPDSLMWGVKTFLAFNIYAWCRIYFYAFDGLKLFGNQKYSVAILAAGATMIPALLGVTGVVLFVAFVGGYIMLYRLLFIGSRAEYGDFVRERGRDATIDRDVASLWNADSGANDRTAREFFDSLDSDHDGHLDRNELEFALSSWGFPDSVIRAFVDKTCKSGVLDFDQFKSKVWCVGAVRQRAASGVGSNEATSERDKAEFVFKQIDLDGDGVIGLVELELLLLEWGLPASEAELYLKIADTDGDGELSPDDFFQRLRPVWRYIYFDIHTAQSSHQETEMIGRSVSAFKDARKTAALRHKVKSELLASVPFLSGATDDLISDLATSLIAESFENGELVFEEGSRGDRFYLIGSGVARISKNGLVISDFGPGACIGEGALLSDAPRAATMSAVRDLTVYSLTRSSFLFLTQKYPKIQEQLRNLHETRRVADIARTIEQELIERVHFLQGSPRKLINDLAKVLVSEQFKAGTRIFTEGELGDRFYLVQDGCVTISKNGVIVAELGKGACFGEGSLLSNDSRWATATATDDSRLFVLSRPSFVEILSQYDGMRESILEMHSKRIARTAELDAAQ